MITVDFGLFPVGRGVRVLDVGCGTGRHTFEAYRRGGDVIALDQNTEDLDAVSAMLTAMSAEGQVPDGALASSQQGDALSLPFADDSFDRVIAAEVLEHIDSDAAAIAEIARVLRPGGLAVVTVPRWFPERICWALSSSYHTVQGGHVRIYKASELSDLLVAAGLRPYARRHAHALHSPYWWLKCAIGPDRENRFVRAYHRLLVWDIVKAPRATRVSERWLNPVLGKSVAIYLRKPGAGT